MADDPLLGFKLRDAEVTLMLGAEDDEKTVGDADAINRLGRQQPVERIVPYARCDKSIMSRRAQSGECKSGTDLRIPDLVISNKPAIANMLIAAEDLIDRGPRWKAASSRRRR
jgi:hypothetical protein